MPYLYPLLFLTLILLYFLPPFLPSSSNFSFPFFSSRPFSFPFFSSHDFSFPYLFSLFLSSLLAWIAHTPLAFLTCYIECGITHEFDSCRNVNTSSLLSEKELKKKIISKCFNFNSKRNFDAKL